MKVSRWTTFIATIFSVIFLTSLGTAYSQQISIPAISGGNGDTITVPILINNAPNPVEGFNLEIVFDNTRLTYTGISTTGTLTDSWSFVFGNPIDNTVFIAGAAITAFPTGTSGTLLNMNFTVNSDACPGEASSFSFQNLGLADDFNGWSYENGSFICSCSEGETQACDTGLSGVCATGTQTCGSDGSWGTCVQDVQPSAETCDNIDNDCDGSVDENLTQTCGSDVGECQSGTQTCSGGAWGACVGEVTASAETCDGLDNDCDSQTDEDFADLNLSCTAGVGACETTGVMVCSGDGSTTECNAVPGTPGTETCNNIDDDCDGTIDEDLTRDTTCGVGACFDNTGIETCDAGTWINDTCDPQAGATTETCDNIDNDCDGSVDEDLTQPCGSDVGECQSGTRTCSGGVWGTCVGEVTASAETCDGLDNDCDGTPDEDFPTLGNPCDGADTDLCQEGTVVCRLDKAGVECDDDPNENDLDLCNGSTADDCNPATADGADETWLETACDGDDSDACEEGVWECATGNKSCSDNTGDTVELCNGSDDDCDGATDEDFADLGDSCTAGTGDCQVSGNMVCTEDGSGTECDATPGTGGAETCNGIDDDCDGATDEDFADLGDSCTAGIGACEAPGSMVCTEDGSGTECDATPGTPTDEVCNFKDDNCDGQTDEGFPLDFTYYSDSDQDTYGDPDGSIQTCLDTPPTGYVEDNTDCNDSDETINPGATEICDDQIDNDCDELVDGADTTTYYLDSDGDGYGTGDAILACEAPGENYVVIGGDCDDTDKAVNPGAAELCNNIDDDCDATIDEDLTQDTTCGVGACSGNTGTETCDAGIWINDTCDPQAGATTETCDNIDNDCDGPVDEDLTQSCGSDVGECQSGTQTCSGGEWGVCDGEVTASAETCDGLDNDCDGTPDEDFPTLGNPCDGDDTDLCEEGTVVCKEDQTGVECNDDPADNDVEICNNIDDDCDGSTDEELTQSCGSDVGECQSGTQTCSAGEWGACVGEVPPADEICNGLDDDCNGTLPLNESDADGDGVMVCAGDCNDADAAKNPYADEVCDGLDNNCNGEIDEGDGVKNTYYSDSDRDSYGDPNSPTEPACHPYVGVVINETDCDDTNNAVYPGAPELCVDGVVNDCNSPNRPDNEEAEGCNLSEDCEAGETRLCYPEGLGICATGTEECDEGSWGGVCTANEPVDEICGNGLDDNCDGIVDNCNTEFKTFVDLSINPILVCFQANQTLDGDPVISPIKGNGSLSGLYNPCPNSSLPVYCAYFTPGSGGLDIVPPDGSGDVVVSIEEVTPVGSAPGSAYARFQLETEFESTSSFCLSQTLSGEFIDFIHQAGCDSEEDLTEAYAEVSFDKASLLGLQDDCSADQSAITEVDVSFFAGVIGDTLVTSVVDVSLPDGVTLDGGVVTITLSFELPAGWTRQEFKDNLKIKHSSDGGLTWTSADISNVVVHWDTSNVVVHWDTMTITFDTASLSMFAGSSKQSITAAGDDDEELKGRGCSIIDQKMPTGNAVANTLVFLLPLIVFGIRRKRGKK
jgi:hypothetical protein